MKFRKRYVSIFFLAVVLVAIGWFVFAFVWSVRYNKSQRGMTANLSSDYLYKTSLVKDSNGYMGIEALVNGERTDTFILDTQASSLATAEMLQRMNAEYDGRKPMPHFNFYGQMYFPKLFRVASIAIGNAMLKGALFNEVAPDNGMYDVLYRPLFGRNILQDFIWQIDNDNDSLIVFANNNPDMLRRYTTGYEKFEDGINSLPVSVQGITPSPFLVDLGSDYDLIIDKAIRDDLAGKCSPRKILSYGGKEDVDTIEEFAHLNVKIGNIVFIDCSAVHLKLVDRNVVGQRFMGRCNFILGYEKDSDGYNSENLYLQKSSRVYRVGTLVPKVGFNVGYRDKKPYITLLDLQGPAATAGVTVGRKVISLNDGGIPVDAKSVNSGITEMKLEQAKSVRIR